MEPLFLLEFTLIFSLSFAQAPQNVSPKGQHFNIDDVGIATVRLYEMTAQASFENQLGEEIQKKK